MGGSEWGTPVHLWLIHVNVGQNHYNIVISLQLKQINKKKPLVFKNPKPTYFLSLPSLNYIFTPNTCLFHFKV